MRQEQSDGRRANDRKKPLAFVRKSIESLLREAEQHVALGESHIRRQRELIVELEADGLADMAERARDILARFENVQSLYVAQRDKLVKELSAKKEGSPR